jgi:hypothetical protein
VWSVALGEGARSFCRLLSATLFVSCAGRGTKMRCPSIVGGLGVRREDAGMLMPPFCSA